LKLSKASFREEKNHCQQMRLHSNNVEKEVKGEKRVERKII